MGKLEQLEQLEKKIKAKWKMNTTLLTQKSDEEMTKTIHDVYLESLESEAIDLHPPMYFFNPEANKEYAKKRNIVFSIAARIESKIDFLITIKIDKDFAILPTRGNSIINQAVIFILREFRYQQKVSLLEVLYKSENMSANFLRNLGQIRDAFAHSLSIADRKYKFEKRDVVQDLKAIVSLVDKAIIVAGKFQSIIEKQPEYLEFKKQLDNFKPNNGA